MICILHGLTNKDFSKQSKSYRTCITWFNVRHHLSDCVKIRAYVPILIANITLLLQQAKGHVKYFDLQFCQLFTATVHLFGKNANQDSNLSISICINQNIYGED